jgi:AraC-like DNA-binding protein
MVFRLAPCEFMSDLSLAPTNDPLGEALHSLRMSAAFYGHSELSAPWGMDLPPIAGSLMFHVVTQGRCWLEVPGEAPLCLQPGDLALVPHGLGHLLLSDPEVEATPLFEIPREVVSERYELMRFGGGGPKTLLICGAVFFDHPAARKLLAALPTVIHVDAWTATEGDWLRSTLRFMGAEAQQMRPGGETIITRLCDVLVVQAIRAWLTNAAEARQGWLGALQDPALGRAITAVHREPGQPWTVASLAKVAAMSRSAFAARFSEVLGETPMKYVTSWRMHLAQSLLVEEDLSLSELAERMGYESEAAFSRAFKRVNGLSPGAARRAKRRALAS